MNKLQTLLVLLGLISITQACTVTLQGLNDDQRQAILDYHNNLRNTLAFGHQSGLPNSSNMNKLKWDSALETRSQELSDMCDFSHSGDSGRGENIATKWGGSQTITTSSLEGMVQMWYDEVEDFNNLNAIAGYTNDGAGGVIGHFTQVVWAASTKVGCGVSVFTDPNENNGASTILFFCQYQSQGNYLGSPIYSEGTHCTACDGDDGCDQDYPALCSDPNTQYDITTSAGATHTEAPSDPNNNTSEGQIIVYLSSIALVFMALLL